MNANKLKSIAVIAMIIDHVAWAFIPLSSPYAQVMHGIGRLTFPIMAFFIAEGFYHTSNLSRYIRRIGLFAILSHIPYQLFTFGRVPIYQPQPTDGTYELFATSVLFTFFISLLVLHIYHNQKHTKWIKYPLITLLLLATLTSDYAIFGPLLVLVYSIYRGDIKKQVLISTLIMIPYVYLYFYPPYSETLFIFGIFFANLFLLRYNGQQGERINPWVSYSFYIIYPAHLLLLGLLQPL